MNRVLITGATGAVGPRVVQMLHDAGYVIRALSADPPDSNLFSDDIVRFLLVILQIPPWWIKQSMTPMQPFTWRPSHICLAFIYL